AAAAFAARDGAAASAVGASGTATAPPAAAVALRSLRRDGSKLVIVKAFRCGSDLASRNSRDVQLAEDGVAAEAAPRHHPVPHAAIFVRTSSGRRHRTAVTLQPDALVVNGRRAPASRSEVRRHTAAPARHTAARR